MDVEFSADIIIVKPRQATSERRSAVEHQVTPQIVSARGEMPNGNFAIVHYDHLRTSAVYQASSSSTRVTLRFFVPSSSLLQPLPLLRQSTLKISLSNRQMLSGPKQYLHSIHENIKNQKCSVLKEEAIHLPASSRLEEKFLDSQFSVSLSKRYIQSKQSAHAQHRFLPSRSDDDGDIIFWRCPLSLLPTP